MLYNFRQNIHRKWFNYWCKDILSTPPLETQKSGLLILSMVSHLDLMLYLVAIKTLYKFLKAGEIAVLNDGTLTKKDINLLKKHIKPIKIININDIHTGKCPKGACWERLLLISDYAKDHYIVQTDSDSLVLAAIPEVICEKIQTLNNNYIEIIAAKNMCKLPEYEQLRYSRCSACFSGFAKNSFSREKVENFSTKMELIIGQRWHEWGTEQVTSDVMICNSPTAEILPYHKYISYYANPEINYSESAYLHFTGTHRFKNGLYIKTAQKQIKALLNGKG
jgi:hypothetical protein